jgi:hypothetical protein
MHDRACRFWIFQRLLVGVEIPIPILVDVSIVVDIRALSNS